MQPHGREAHGEAHLTLDQVAQLVGGRVQGEGGRRVRDVAPLDQAGPDELGLLAERGYLRDLAASSAGALLVSETLSSEAGDAWPLVVVEDAHAALVPLLAHLHPPRPTRPAVHATAVLASGVHLGAGVEIGPYAVLEEGVQLGEGVRIGAHVVVGEGCLVGEGSVLHPHVVLYPRTVLGRRVIVHSGARLGSDGFGYAFSDGQYRKIPQVGRCVLEDDVEIGANTTVDRGSIGDTVIGQGSKLDNLVHLAHNVRVGPACAMAALVGIAGSTRIGRGVVFGGQAGAAGHLEIGDGARVAAGSGAIGDVRPGVTVAGFPARDIKEFMKASAATLRLPELARRVRTLERALGVPPGGGKDSSA